MNAFATWFLELWRGFLLWWRDKRPDRIIGRGIERIGIGSARLVVVGIVINIIAAHFYPEFPNRFPIIYGWFDGWLQLGEFAIKAAIGFINAIFTGTLSEFWTSYTAAYEELFAQFVNWVSQITF